MISEAREALEPECFTEKFPAEKLERIIPIESFDSNRESKMSQSVSKLTKSAKTRVYFGI